jgi:hypothetical protein
MANDEIRMTNETASPNNETAASGAAGSLAVSSLPFRHSFVIQASDFVIAASRFRKHFLRFTWCPRRGHVTAQKGR